MELQADIDNGHDLILHCISEYYTGIVLLVVNFGIKFKILLS